LLRPSSNSLTPQSRFHAGGILLLGLLMPEQVGKRRHCRLGHHRWFNCLLLGERSAGARAMMVAVVPQLTASYNPDL